MRRFRRIIGMNTMENRKSNRDTTWFCPHLVNCDASMVRKNQNTTNLPSSSAPCLFETPLKQAC